ncbi:hypothetical protein ACN38_g7862 [Penicillium nordicum]|uniref:Secreted protein n=1 Tax=Penicillium nordicum TaxID=229535 RepID=A0A0M9WE11_9EURO|nr:hypothetical protein ACN38_g7862 [Penicillium nordicum]
MRNQIVLLHSTTFLVLLRSIVNEPAKHCDDQSSRTPKGPTHTHSGATLTLTNTPTIYDATKCHSPRHTQHTQSSGETGRILIYLEVEEIIQLHNFILYYRMYLSLQASNIRFIICLAV